jgi:charged multivesicular body protein 4A/B
MIKILTYIYIYIRMGNTTSNKKPKTSLITAISTNKQTVAMLQKKINYNEKRVDRELEKARQFKKIGNKTQALMCLKRKKMLEKQMEQLTAQMMNLESQSMAMEGMASNKSMVETIQTTNSAMKQLNKEMDVDKVEDLVDDLRENIDNSNEISEILASPVGDLADLDDDSILNELEEIEQEIATEQQKTPDISKTQATPFSIDTLPKVPETQPVSSEDNEDAVLQELEALMS